MENNNKKQVRLEINPTIGGGSFELVVDLESSVDVVKGIIGKKLRVGKESIILLHRERLLENHSLLSSYNLADGSRLSLVPSIETGLVTQRPEQSVLEALEGLNEGQVGDFLSGKSPLNLTMRLGDHVMLIQLQLSKGQHHSSSTSTTPSCTITTPIDNLPSTSSASSSASTTPPETTPPIIPPTTPTGGHSLVEASRNLTNTLKKLSTHVTTEKKGKKRRRSVTPTKKVEQEKEEEKEGITNHMQHHGKGVYSGCFTGTLNPSLQDNLGKPKKHVSTIVHILNDLLGGVQGGATTSSSSSKKKKKSVPPATVVIAPELTEEERAQENEVLRLKILNLKEQLKLRRDKKVELS